MFDASLRGTIPLSSGDLNIAKDLTIRGPGADSLSISSDKSGYFVRVIRGVTVTISSLTFKGSKTSNGSIAGFIVNEGTLMLSNSTISGNTVYRNGLFNGGTLTLNDSTISGNTAVVGGGIFNGGALAVNHSTISGNTAVVGGGIFIQSAVDASRALIAHVDLTFSTIYSNSAYGGGDIAIEDVAFSFNGNNKAIKQISQVKIRNSIVAGNPAHPGSDIVGMLTSYAYNLFQEHSGATFDPATSMQHGTDKTLSLNDLITLFAEQLELRDNGGPTRTYALAPGSPAIDAVPFQYCQVPGIFNSPSRMYTDQRGVKRPDDNENKCDIGAYELNEAA